MLEKKRSESGQVMVLLILAIVGLVGFAALALDGGMLYSERRHAQGAADAAALAAAFAKVKGTNLHSAALDRLLSNKYPVTYGPCTPAGPDCTHGVGTQWSIEISNPPRSGEYMGDANFIQVFITSEIQPALAHLVYPGPLVTTVEAVARVRPSQNFAPGYALYGASEHDCKGIWFSGTGDTNIVGGSVKSNSDAASASCQSGVQDGSGNLSVGPPPHGIDVVGTFDAGGSGSVDPTPVEGVGQDELRPLPEPECPTTDYGSVKVNASEVATLSPGRYKDITVLAGGTANLNPGMYCIYGHKGFTGNGGTITGTGIMIYMQDGPFDLGGNSVVNLAAEPDDGDLVDASGNDWKGMLVYVDPSNTDDITLTGGSGTTYTGTVIALTSDCTVNGTGGSIGLLSSQLICDTVKITGTAEVNIEFNESETYSLPPAIDLAK
jgi:hypothetical protein